MSSCEMRSQNSRSCRYGHLRCIVRDAKADASRRTAPGENASCKQSWTDWRARRPLLWPRRRVNMTRSDVMATTPLRRPLMPCRASLTRRSGRWSPPSTASPLSTSRSRC
jgi:hypothetical protein